jgi:hypothetical protein
MRLLLLISLLFVITSCATNTEDLKSPCVAIESQDGSPSPCIKRNVNSHWLI